MGIDSKVHINSVREMPHGRVIRLSWADGSRATIRLDHGFCCWSIDGRGTDWYDINNSPANQVEMMYKALAKLEVRYSKRFPTQVFVKTR